MNRLVLVLVLFLLGHCVSSAQITFEKTYGGVLTEEGKSVRQTWDDGYIIGGTNLVRTNDSGRVLWTKPYPSEYASTTWDSAYILVHNDNNVYFTKVDQMGDTIWNTSYSAGLWAREAHSIEQTKDGGYIVAGHYQDFSGSGMMLLKLNASGHVVWRKTWSEPTSAGFGYGLSAHETSDKGYIIVGYTYIDYYDSNKHKDIFVAKADSLGNNQWLRNFGDSTDEFGYDVHETSDGHYLIAGSQYDLTSSNTKMYLLKLNTMGDTIWTRRYGGLFLSELKSVWETTDGAYVLAGSSNSSTSGGATNLSVLKVDTAGSILWDKEYGHTDFDYANEIRQTTDGGFIVTGLANLGGIPNGDMYLLKLDSLGNMTFPTSISEMYDKINIHVYPNPSEGIIYIKSNISNATIRIFNFEGREVFEQKLERGKTKIEIPFWAMGIYLYQVQQSEEVLKRGKLVIK